MFPHRQQDTTSLRCWCLPQVLCANAPAYRNERCHRCRTNRQNHRHPGSTHTPNADSCPIPGQSAPGRPASDCLPPATTFGNKLIFLARGSDRELGKIKSSVASSMAVRWRRNTGRALMQKFDLTTVSLLYLQDDTTFISRNAFAIGGVVEDPATGAAAAALGGALVDLDWPSLRGGWAFQIRQGEDMGYPSHLNVAMSGVSGDSVRVAGTTRKI